jgi:hypothetical protein
MRTTIRIDPRLLAEAKRVAADTNRSLTAVIEDALREIVRRRRRPTRRRVSLTTVGGKGPNPGVNLDDSAALVDLMEGRHGPR